MSKPSLTWPELNKTIINITSQQALEEMIEDEIQGRCRSRYIYRIHSRLNKVRADSERKTLERRISEK